ncbi:hypothetical protein LEMLEM_LOCUS9269, partial [Lemmus lemmus]
FSFLYLVGWNGLYDSCSRILTGIRFWPWQKWLPSQQARAHRLFPWFPTAQRTHTLPASLDRTSEKSDLASRCHLQPGLHLPRS